MGQMLVKGFCPKCNARIGFYIEATYFGVVILDMDESWHVVKCPACGARINVEPNLE